MIAALLRAMRGQPAGATPLADSDAESPAFVRGLALGAFVGAAIAGSTLWRRFQGRSRNTPSGPDSTTDGPVPE